MNATADMTDCDDRALIERYVTTGSGSAFAELVRRHVNHVYSAALRRVNGDRALAEDVTQTVFIDLARHAGRWPADAALGGWLHRHTGFTASKMIDRERRRRSREQEAAAMQETAALSPDPAWIDTAPVLDSAMDTLSPPERDALVLRFFEGRDFRSIGGALGVSDDTAQKRVSRALEKLRAVLQSRGVTSTGGALAALLTTYAVMPAPSAFAADLSLRALGGAASGAGWSAAEAFGRLGRAARRHVTAGAAALLTAGAAVPMVWEKARSSPASAPSSATGTAQAATDQAPASISAQPAAPATPPEPSSDDPATIVAQAAEILKGGQETVSATGEALSVIRRLKPESMRAALAETGKVPDQAARVLLYKYLLALWAETDPLHAVQFASSDVPEAQRASLCEGVLSAWSARNPDAALGWEMKTAGMGTRPVSESLMATMFRSLASRNLPAAFNRLRSLATPNDRAQALRGMLDLVQTASDRQRALDAVNQIGDSEVRLQARRAVVEQWARKEPEAAASWVLKAEPPWERTRLMDSLGLVWLQSDPASAATWWASAAPGPDTLVKIVNVWAQLDPNAAGEWLATQPRGAASDTARMTFSRQVADLDPESALRWAETVSDAPLREGTIDHVFADWKTRDAAAAQAFLDRSGWPPDRRQRLMP